MAFVTIAASRTDADSPIDQSLMDDIRTNLDDLDGARVTNGDSHDHEGGDGAKIPQGGLASYATGSEIVEIADTERTGGETVYTLKKQIVVARAGTLNIAFQLKVDTGVIGTAYGKIYKNGSPAGTERSTTLSTYTNYEEDISVAIGDNIELYAKASSGYSYFVKNFRLLSVEATSETVLLD
jgi:hypothetical protein